MPKGVPASGFRKTRKFLERHGEVQPDANTVGGEIHETHPGANLIAKFGPYAPFMPRGFRVAGGSSGKTTPTIVGTGVVPFMARPDPVVEPVSTETDDEILARIIDHFETMEHMCQATFDGQNRAMIISGPPGLGKSYTVNKIGDKIKADHKDERVITFISGNVLPTGLYRTLYENRFKKNIVVFDDSDSIFSNELSLNILKKATDMTRTRKIDWLAETKMRTEIETTVTNEETGEEEKEMIESRIPRSFEFEGAVIFITNYDFDYLITMKNRLTVHLEAMISRSLYLDLGMKTNRDYLVWIREIVGRGMITDMGMGKLQEKMIMDFIEMNYDILRELSLRMVVKLVQIYKIHPERFEANARMTCCKKK